MTWSYIANAKNSAPHTCGIRSDAGYEGKVYCWGYNGNGRLGDNSTTNRTTGPVAVGTAAPFTSATFVKVVAGNAHTCALTSYSGGDIWCWGLGTSGQLGNGASATSNVPVKVTGGYSFVDVLVGYNSACGLTTTGQAYCWGDNAYGQLGDGTTTDKNSPTLPLGNFTFTALYGGAGGATYSSYCGIVQEE